MGFCFFRLRTPQRLSVIKLTTFVSLTASPLFGSTPHPNSTSSLTVCEAVLHLQILKLAAQSDPKLVWRYEIAESTLRASGVLSTSGIAGNAKEQFLATMKLRKAKFKGLTEDSIVSVAREVGLSEPLIQSLINKLNTSEDALFDRLFMGDVPKEWLEINPKTGALIDSRDRHLKVITICVDEKLPCDPSEVKFVDLPEGGDSFKTVDQPNVLASMTFWYSNQDPTRTLTIDFAKVDNAFEGFGLNTTMIRKVVRGLDPPPSRIATDYLDMTNAEKFYQALLSGLKGDPGSLLVNPSIIPENLKGKDHAELYRIFEDCCAQAFIPRTARRDGAVVTPLLADGAQDRLESALKSTNAGQTRKSVGYDKICPDSMRWKWVPSDGATQPERQGKFKITFAGCP